MQAALDSRLVRLLLALTCALLVAALAGGASAQSKPAPQRQGKDVALANPAARFVPGEVVVRFRQGVSTQERQAALATESATLVEDLRLQGLVLADLAPGKTVAAAIAGLERRSDVLYAEPNWIYRPTATPNDPRFGELWGLNNTGQSGGTPDADIDAPEAWNTTTGSASVVVAVTDTGVAYDHPDLAPNMWTNPDEVANGLDDDGNGKVDDIKGWDFIGNDNDPRDLSGHGTHVAGTIGARGNNSTGVTGVNWNVKLMPVRVLGTQGGTNATVTNGFDYAGDEGAKVVNASLGGGGFSQAMKDVIDAHAATTLYVVAAGNGGSDGVGDNNDVTPQYPCNITSTNLVCVAATTDTDGLAGFSNFGATSVDLGAPGTEILSTWPAYDSKFADGFETATGWVPGIDPGPPPFTNCASPAPNNTWARTTETAVFGSWSATDSPGASYVNCQNNWFRMPGTFNFTGSVGCQVAYAMRLETESNFDWFVVDASTNGSSWTEVAAWTGSTQGSWFPFEEDLSAYDGSPSVHLRFGLEADESFTLNGAHVDGVDVRCIGTSYGPTSYETIQGTSMATPHVSGVAALAWAKNPGVSVAAVKTALLNGGDSKPALSGKSVSGRRLNANGTLALISEPASPTLTVTKGGNGNGTVTGTGIDCGSDCTESYAPGTMVTLTATPQYASTVAGWVNCDSPSGNTCTVTMSASKTVTVTLTTTPTFVDVPPSNPHYGDIEHLFDLGITQGCAQSGGQLFFCPADNVPREQMAAFIVRAMGLSQLFPGTPTFADVPVSSVFFGYVERLFEQGITGGCLSSGGQLFFCPKENVPRQQMAAFLVRAKGLTQLFPPTPTFADVPPSNPFFGYIERLVQTGITQGCGTSGGQLLYCPDGLVPRQQMASFLIRAFA